MGVRGIRQGLLLFLEVVAKEASHIAFSRDIAYIGLFHPTRDLEGGVVLTFFRQHNHFPLS